MPNPSARNQISRKIIGTDPMSLILAQFTLPLFDCSTSEHSKQKSPSYRPSTRILLHKTIPFLPSSLTKAKNPIISRRIQSIPSRSHMKSFKSNLKNTFVSYASWIIHSSRSRITWLLYLFLEEVEIEHIYKRSWIETWATRSRRHKPHLTCSLYFMSNVNT